MRLSVTTINNFHCLFTGSDFRQKNHLTDKWTSMNKFMQEMYHVSKSIIY